MRSTKDTPYIVLAFAVIVATFGIPVYLWIRDRIARLTKAHNTIPVHYKGRSYQ